MKNKIGERFGRLTVLGVSERTDSKHRKFYDCLCDCGKKVCVRGDTLKTGSEKSCGCVGIEILKKMSTKHNMSDSRLYKIWGSMKTRCYRKTAINYYLYGGRGIKVCDEWKNNFIAFYDWAIKNGYKDGLTIDRIDNEKDYCPSNCRWATAKQQGNNRRNNRYISFNGKTHTMSEWSKITGVAQYNIYNRLQDNWTVKDALTKKEHKYRQRKWSFQDGLYQHKED